MPTHQYYINVKVNKVIDTTERRVKQKRNFFQLKKFFFFVSYFVQHFVIKHRNISNDKFQHHPFGLVNNKQIIHLKLIY